MRTNDHGQPIGEALDGWLPPPPPTKPVLPGRFCRLEPLTEAHADDLFEALHDDPSGRQWTYMSIGPFTDRDEFAAYVRTAVADPATVVLAIVDPRTDRAAGMASYARIMPAAGAIEVASVMFGGSLRCTPAGTETMYLMARHVFDDLGYRRYEWKCDVLNAASQAAARRLGFAYEGTWRKAVIYKDRNRDTAWFAMTDDDWRALRPAFETWLAPANFADGRQLTSLSEQTAKVRASLDA